MHVMFLGDAATSPERDSFRASPRSASGREFRIVPKSSGYPRGGGRKCPEMSGFVRVPPGGGWLFQGIVSLDRYPGLLRRT